MDYRDQLKYIKFHQNDAKAGKKQKSRKRKVNLREPEYLDWEDEWEELYGYEPEQERRSKEQRRKPRQNGNRTNNRNRRSEPRRNERDKRPAKVGVFSRFLWLIQLAASVFLFGSMAVLGILPMQYMAGLIVILLLLLVLVKNMQKRASKRGKKRSSGKGIAVVMSAVALMVGFYGLKVNGALDKIAIGEEKGNYSEEHALDVTEKPFNVYISGIDVYGEITKESRSDVNLIATINPKTHKILLTTTPRDYYVTIPGVSGEQRDKLTHAGIYGIDTSIATLENLYDTEIPFYVRVNFTSVEEIVDVMGGVDVESELAFTTSKAAGAIVEVKEGKNHFTGKEALAFVRERKNLAGGDNQRGKNQQAMLTGLIKKSMSPMILFRANGMINSVAGNAETNMSEAQIKSLIRMQIGDMKGWEIESVAATGDDSGKRNCYSYKGKALYVTVPNQGSVEEIREKIRENMGE